MAGGGMLYLDAASIAALALPPAAVLGAVEAAFAGKPSGRSATLKGSSAAVDPDVVFHAKGGLAGPHAAIKWFGHVTDRERGKDSFDALILLNDARSGAPLALIEGAWISAARTAAISTLAARLFVSQGPLTLGFIACGRQALAHLEMMAALLPVARVLAASGGPESAQRLCRLARQSGIATADPADPDTVLAGSDVIVTSVPRTAGSVGRLDAHRLGPRAFAAMVDLGHSWRRETLPAFTTILTDDRDQGGGHGGFNLDEPITLDLAACLAGEPAPRDGRAALMFSGSGLADAAVAGLVYEAARAAGVGRPLAR